MGLWELDLTTRDRHWCELLYSVLEVHPSDINPCCETFVQFIHPLDRGRVIHYFTESLESRKAQNLVHRLPLTNGKVKWVNQRWQPADGELATTSHLEGTMVDITDVTDQDEQVRCAQSSMR